MHRIASIRFAVVPTVALLAACNGRPSDPNASTTGALTDAGASATTADAAPADAPATSANAPTDTVALDPDYAPVIDDGAAGENAEGDPVEVVGGAQAPVDEAGDMVVEGREGDDPGWDAVLASAAPSDPSDDEANAASEPVMQKSDALLSTRGTSLYNEAYRNTSYLKLSTSYYSHSTYMNESTGTRRTDCSGLVGYVLTRVQRAAYDKIPHPNTYKPLADDYYRYFASRPTSASTQTSTRWRRISSFRDLKKGDVVVWLSPSGSENTGHMMVVRDTPRAGRSSRNEVLVPVIDSTSTPHSYLGAYDSRGTSRTGVGKGTIGIKVDSSGAPRAYYWTGGKSTTAVFTKIAAGRVE